MSERISTPLEGGANKYLRRIVGAVRETVGADFSRKVAGTFATRLALICVGLLTTVIVARALGPSGRGLYGVAMVVAAIGTQFGNLGLHAANIYYAARDRDLMPALLGNSLLSSVLLGGSCVFFVYTSLWLWPGLAPVQGPLLLLCLAWIPFGLVYVLMQSLLVGTQHIKEYNIIELCGKLLALCLIVAAAMISASAESVFFASLLALVFSAGWAFRRVRTVSGQMPIVSRGLFKATFSYGFYAYAAALLSFMVLKFDLLIVTYKLGTTQAGYYAVAVGMADVIYMLPIVVGTILLPKLSAITDALERWMLAKRAAGATLALVSIMLIVAIPLAEPATRLLFGSDFMPAVPAFIWLLPAMFFLSAGTIYQNYLGSTGDSAAMVYGPLAAFCINIAANLYLIDIFGIVGASYSSVIAYAVFTLIAWLVSKNRVEQALRQTAVAGEAVITKQSLIDVFRAKKRVRERNPVVKCDAVAAVPYRDILELFLAASGCSGWRWIDDRGRVEPRKPGIISLARLVADIFSWPLLYLRVVRSIIRLEAKTCASRLAAPSGRTILFLRTDHWFNVRSGGSVGHLRGVIQGFRGHDRDVHVVSTDYLAGVEDDDNFHLCEPDYGVGANLPNLPEILYSEQIVKTIAARWEQWIPSFIYQRYSQGNYAGVLLKAEYGVPYVCEYNGSFPWMARNWGGKRLFHERLLSRIEMLNLRAADLIVVVSEQMADELTGRGIVRERILVNPNGVDPEMFTPEIDGAAIREEYGLSGKIVIGFIGTFGRWHGAEVLAEAFGALLREHPDYRARAHLLMIGDGPMMHRTQALIEESRTGDCAVFTGSIDQEKAPEYLAACDIVVSPHVPNPDGTPFFGSPTKLFEYMALGKAIIASDLEQVGKVLEHDTTAWLVAPGDAAALMHGLKSLIDDAPLRKSLGAAAREKAVRDHTWALHSSRILDALQEREVSI